MTRRQDPERQGNWLALGVRSEAIRSCRAEKRREPSDVFASPATVLRRDSVGPPRERDSKDNTAVGVLSTRVAGQDRAQQRVVGSGEGERGSESECI